MVTTPPEFRYAMVNRPFGIGCAPKEGFVRMQERPAAGQDHHDYARHGIAVYSRELSVQETRMFEMAPLLEGEALHAAVEQVSQDMSEYAAQYAQMAFHEDPRKVERFAVVVSDRLKSTSSGFTPSVGNFAAFQRLVADRLLALCSQEMVPAEPAPH